MFFVIVNVEVVLVNLVYYFDWVLLGKVEGMFLDMIEYFGFIVYRNSFFFVLVMFYEYYSKMIIS